ncbi:MAG: VWA domain-containing protein [Myxococcota bacterium]
MKSRWPGIALHYLAAALLAVGGWWAFQAFGPEVRERLADRDLFIEDPRYFWGLLVIPLLVVFRAHTLSDLPKLQQALSLLLRAGLVAAVVLSLVNVQEVTREPVKTATVFAVDVSESVPDAALDAARERVEDAWRKRADHTVRLVRFAGEAREVQLPEGPDAEMPPLERFEGDKGRETDVQGALRFAFTLFPDDRLKRLVLVTDGLETTGSMLAEEDSAERFGVTVHHLDLTDLERPDELMVVDVDAPENVRPNIPFTTTAVVRSTGPMKATCELLVDGVLSETREVDLQRGDNPVTVEAKVGSRPEAGTRETGGDRRLTVECKPGEEASDRFASNNRFEVPVHVLEKPKILYIEGERRFRRNLLSALERDFEVELRGARGVPSTLADARKYDLIFISDVPRVGAMGTPNMTRRHMVALEEYAQSGGGLVFAGGENSFGPGGYTDTHLERKVLPVRLDVQKKEDIPSLALMLVIDRSGSMSGPKIELAKEAARATLDVLQPSDELGIIAFDSAPTTVVRLQRAANRLRITDSLARLSPGGGTNIFPALDQAYQDLASTRAKVKHIILLSDGQSNKAGILDLVAQSYLDKITISTVAVGMGSDQGLLMQMAEEGGGRYYFTDRPDNIPKLFLKEASEVSRRALVEDRFRPAVVKRYRHLQMFRGVGMDKAPPLLGYISTRAKRRAEVLMTSHLGEPILARWRLGLGQVVVWTSDVKNKWAHFWLSWPGYAQFFRQLIRDTLRVEHEDPTFPVHVDVADGTLTVGVDAVDADDRFIDALDSQVTVTAPDGTDHDLTLTQTAPGRFTGTLPLDQFGPYTVKGTHHPTADADSTHRSYAAVSYPFPPEHLLGPPDLTPVRTLTAATGGTAAPTNTALFDTQNKTTEHRQPRWPLPLYAALALLLLDTLLRRIRLYGSTALPWSSVAR